MLDMVAKLRSRNDWCHRAQETSHRCCFLVILTDPQDQNFGAEKGISLRAVAGARVDVLA